MMQRSVGLRANSRRSRGKIAFSGRSGKSPLTYVRRNGLRALRANASGVRSNCPGPLRRGLFALSPTPSESLNLSLPAACSPFSSIPHAKVRVSTTTKPLFYLINRYHT